MKSFLLGVVTGIILTIATLFVYGLISQKSEVNEVVNEEVNDPIKYLENPVSYENKKVTSFKVLQVFEHAALALEASDKIGDHVMYGGNTVLILGEDYYSDQIITVKNPMRIGTFDYTTNSGMPMTVPVINGEMK